MKPLKILLACSMLAAAPAQAALVYGLTCANELVSFDSASPGSVNFIGNISAPGIVDIDFFPVTGQLYGITSTGVTFDIDPTTALATFLFAPSTQLADITDFDFNPVTDRMRLFGEGGLNFEMVPGTSTGNPGTPGDVTFDGAFPANLELVASAYSNNFDGAPSTTLYSIDFNSDSAMVHAFDSQSNSVTTLGPLGIKLGSFVGFDITPDGTPLMNDGNDLYAVNLANGQLTPLGEINVHDLAAIAAVPEPGTAILAALGGLLMLQRSRRRTRV